MKFRTVPLFGFDFIAANNVEEIAVVLMDDAARNFDHQVKFLITLNAFLVVNFLEAKNHSLLENYKRSAYVLPDGMPIVWVSKFRESKLINRLTGSDLFPVFWSKIKEKKYAATFVLPSNNLVDLFSKDYALCNSFVPKFFSADDEDYINAFAGQVADGIMENGSQVLFLGLTFPKQEMLGIRIANILRRKNYNKGVLILLLGASFEFYFNIKKRAPVLFQKTGTEWLYRFALEPKRLWKRYTIDNIRFINLAIKEITRKK